MTAARAWYSNCERQPAYGVLSLFQRRRRDRERPHHPHIALDLPPRRGDGRLRAGIERRGFGVRAADRSAVQFHQLTRDREPQPEPAVLPRERRIRLPELVEYERKKCLRDARAGVAHLEHRFAVPTADVDRHASA